MVGPEWSVGKDIRKAWRASNRWAGAGQVPGLQVWGKSGPYILVEAGRAFWTEETVSQQLNRKRYPRAKARGHGRWLLDAKLCCYFTKSYVQDLTLGASECDLIWN